LVDDYKDYLKHVKTFQPEIEYEEERLEIEKEEERIEAERRSDLKTLRTELAKIRARSREIMLEDMKFKESGSRRTKEEIEYFCKRHKVTYTNYLKTSSRTFKKLQKRCNANGEKQAEKGTGINTGRAKVSKRA